MRRRVKLLAGVALVLSGCASGPNLPRVIDAQYIATVQRDLKRQVGIYNASVQYYRGHPDQDPAMAGPRPACGDRRIDFDITSLKIDLATTNDNTNKGGASATIPVTAVISVTPSGSVSREVTDVEELIYSQWPLPATEVPVGFQPPAPEGMPPLAAMLLKLRAGLLEGAQTRIAGQPVQCFRDFDLNKFGDSPHTYKMGLTVVNDGLGGLAVKLGILQLGATHETKNTDANTLTVSFRQSDLGQFDGDPSAKIGPCKADRDRTCIVGKDREFPIDPLVGVGFAPP